MSRVMVGLVGVCLGVVCELAGASSAYEQVIAANADVIAQVAGALISVGATVLSVVVMWRGALWVFLLVGGDARYEYGWSQDDEGNWFHSSDSGGDGYGPDGDLSREEYDAIYPVDPADADDWRNYDWNDDNDPQGHFHTRSPRSYPEEDWTMADLKFAADRGDAGAKAEFERRSAEQGEA